MGIKRTIILFLIVTVTLSVTGLLYMLYRDTKPPSLDLKPSKTWVSGHTEFVVEAKDPDSGLKMLVVEAVAGDQRVSILNKVFPDTPQEVKEVFTLENLAFKDGAFELEVRGVDGSFAHFGKGNGSSLNQGYQLDNTPPKINITTTAPNITQGGSACLAFKVSEETVVVGVMAGETFFPAHPQDKGGYLCFFAYPYNLGKDQYKPYVYARDYSDNVSQAPIPCHLKPADFKSDTIRLPDSFLETKMPDFESEYPDVTNLLERFLKVNNELRVQGDEELRTIGLDTGAKILWEGVFLRMPRTATTATFADHREYVYNGKVVDEQTHMGIDLASTQNDEVPAANSGLVVYANDLGIYGLTVIIDHGLGLQSLYAHLSEIFVSTGDTISKGHIVGRTGTTGMAGGDHLHFGMLISGVPVNPVEWWDPKWITNNITDRLK